MKNDGTYSISQSEKLDEVKFVKKGEQFKNVRYKLQYVGVMSPPDIFAQVQLLAPVSDAVTKEERELLNKVIEYCQHTSDKNLHFVKLDNQSAKLVLLTDLSFGNARYLTSQLGFVLVLIDMHVKCNIYYITAARVASKLLDRSCLLKFID